MVHKLSLAVAETVPLQKAQAPLVPNYKSDGMKLVKTALANGRIVSTKGMSKDEYIAHLKNQKDK